jgi:hypothetical protein
MSSMILLRNGFAEILPRFISKPISHKAHRRIFSDRDPLFYWLYARYEFGAGISLVFITPRSARPSEGASLASLPINPV